MDPIDRLLARVGKTREDLPAKSKLGKILYRGGVKNTPELQRILRLPHYDWQADPAIADLGEFIKDEYGLPRRSACLPRCGHAEPIKACRECDRAHHACACQGKGEMWLRPVQTAALQQIHDHGGMIANIRVGGGKTLISFLAGNLAGAERVLLIVPAALVKKTLREFAYLKRHWISPRRIHVMSYELLARDRGIAELGAYRPDLIVADEAQKFKNRRAACTIRINRYLAKINPDCGYVDMSGTMTKRSIMEYHHRVLWAVPDGLQALPRDHNECADWADAIDEKSSSAGRLLPGALLQMCTHEEILTVGEDPRKSLAIKTTREAYARRFFTAPGVVGTTETFDGAMPLLIQAHEIDVGRSVIEAFSALRTDWCLPDGRPVESPAELWMRARQLIQGFYYRWEPEPPREWLMLRKIWSAAIRQILKDYRDLDSPLMATRAVDSGRIPWAREPLEDWRAIKDTYTPTIVSTWIDTACLEWAAKWAKSQRGIIWTWEKEFAERLSRETGLPYYGSKGLCGKRMIEDETGPCIASIKANREGRNLQQHSRNAIVSTPPGGDIWEQLLGRTHRDGQLADEVTGDVPLSCYEQWNVFRQACRDAEYTESTMRQAQKLNFADIEVQSEEEIQRRHADGDPLWCKANAEFFESDDYYTSRDVANASIAAYRRGKEGRT